MNFCRANRVFRVIAVLMAVTGWLVLSNHCALGKLATAETMPSKAEHACCQGNAPAADEAPEHPQPKVQCCKDLHAVMPPGGEFVTASVPVLLLLPAVWMLAQPMEKTGDPLIEVDTGPPPRVISFSQLVLQRSLQSHAPPFCA